MSEANPLPSLEEFLKHKAKELHPHIFDSDWLGGPNVQFAENANDDALSDAWLERGTSYILKVGVLAVIDPNKCDWVHLFIGHKREKDHPCEFIGELYWQDGENDDIGRCLRRYLKCADMLHPVFEDD